MIKITVGVLALQGAFHEHVVLLKKAAASLVSQQVSSSHWDFLEVRNSQELERCDALVLPGGESTAISLVAARSNLLEPLRDFVKYVCFTEVSEIGCMVTDSYTSSPQGASQADVGNLCRIDFACGVGQPD